MGGAAQKTKVNFIMRHDEYNNMRDSIHSTNDCNMASKDLCDQLKDLTLEDVIPQNKELGRGAYGKVFTVDFLGLPCAAKEIHSLLLDGISPEEKKAIKDGFIRECYHSSLIRHPNIVQFMGIYYAKPSDPKTDLPIMVHGDGIVGYEPHFLYREKPVQDCHKNKVIYSARCIAWLELSSRSSSCRNSS